MPGPGDSRAPVRYEELRPDGRTRDHAFIARSRFLAVIVLVVAVGGFSTASAGAHRTADAAVLGPARAEQPLQLVIPLVASEAALERFAVTVATPEWLCRRSRDRQVQPRVPDPSDGGQHLADLAAAVGGGSKQDLRRELEVLVLDEATVVYAISESSQAR